MHSKKKHHSIALAHDHRLEVSPGGESLTIHGASGVELVLTAGPEGVRVQLSAAALDISTGILNLDCRRFELHASEGARFSTDGDFEISAAGDVDVRASGHARLQGRESRIRATGGDVEVDARDEVRVLGERISLN